MERGKLNQKASGRCFILSTKKKQKQLYSAKSMCYMQYIEQQYITVGEFPFTNYD